MTSRKRKFIGRLRPRFTFSNMMASVAVFAVLGGSAYAAATIGTSDIKDGAVTNAKLGGKIQSRWATVHHNGTLINGRKASDAGKVGMAESLYAVTFDRDVSECASVATLTEVTGGDNLGFVSTEPSGSDPNEVIVETRDTGGSTDPRSFHLQVSC
jgi:hypothetical protein